MEDAPLKTPLQPGPWQFTLRRMFVASGIVACACAVAGWAYRTAIAMPSGAMSIGVLGILLSPLLIGGLLGAAIGSLAGRIVRGVLWGILGTTAIAALLFVFLA